VAGRLMPLTRSNVTVASRIMLPTYVVLTTMFGLVYVIDPFGSLGNISALRFQRSVMPMAAWGAILLALSALMVVAFTRQSRMLFAFALACCAMTWFLWGGMYAVSVALAPTEASLNAPILPWFVSVACVASMASLLKGEVS
jgi:hypothetical protein